MQTEKKHTYNLIMVMAIGGVLGGIGNYFLLPANAPGSFWRSFFLGIVAAGVIPLFLKMISSNLMHYEKGGSHYKNYLTLAAFCILAGVFADVFLQGIYRKVFHEFEETLETYEQRIVVSERKSEMLKENIQKVAQYNRPKLPQSAMDQLQSKYQLSTKELQLYQQIQDSLILEVNDSTEFFGTKLEKLSKNKLININGVNGAYWISPNYQQLQVQKINPNQ